MALKLITAPAAEPILLATAKAHLRVDHANDDTLIDALITAARQAAEDRTGRAIITQTWELVLDAFPANEIQIAKPPVTGITSVKYIDTAGAEQTLGTDQYLLDADAFPGWLLLAYGASWPDTQDAANAVRIRFTCGYGASESAVPAALRQWMLIAIATMYAQREATSVGLSVAEVPRNFIDGLLDPYRLMVL